MGVVCGDVVGGVGWGVLGLWVGVEGVLGEEEEMGTPLGSCRGDLLGRRSWVVYKERRIKNHDMESGRHEDSL